MTGKPIAREDMSGLHPTPGHTRARDTASALSKAVAYWANLASGGTAYKPGFFSPTPDQIDYLIGQVTGGVGREALKAEQTVTSMMTGEELPAHKVPLLGRFYGDTTGQASRAPGALRRSGEEESNAWPRPPAQIMEQRRAAMACRGQWPALPNPSGGKPPW